MPANRGTSGGGRGRGGEREFDRRLPPPPPPLPPSQYASEADLPLVTSLVDAELSEPYSIFTYRYFLRNWPSLCVLALDRRGATSAPGATARAPRRAS